MVASLTRNARAISRVDSPPTVFRVSATRPASGSAGWQQVNSSRSRSSPYVLPYGSSSGSAAGCSAQALSSASLLASVRRRRNTSNARWWAVVVSHAAGLSGVPSRGQRTSARSTASCTQSSARSQSPVSRIRAATIRSRSSAMVAASGCVIR